MKVHMVNAQQLDKASGMFFFSAFMMSKLQYVPFALVAGIFRFLSLGLYLAGYGLWFASSYLRPDQKEHLDKWYGFAKMKEQFIISSAIGFVATALSVVAVFVPVLFPPAAWLFFLGNIVWAIGEYHKLKNPPVDEEQFSTSRQSAYLAYATTTTGISLITAISTTLMIIFPPAAIPITIFSLLVCTGLGFMAFEFWLNSSFEAHKPDSKTNSYIQMEDGLGTSPSHDNTPSPEPYHGKDLFVSVDAADNDSIADELDDVMTTPLVANIAYNR